MYFILTIHKIYCYILYISFPEAIVFNARLENARSNDEIARFVGNPNIDFKNDCTNISFSFKWNS